MAEINEINSIIESLKQIKPNEVFNHINRANEGILCLLSYLEKCDGKLTAGELAQAINVSTARIAVLLKNLEKKELIIRSSDDLDARKSIICISDKGKELIQKTCLEINNIVGTLVDKIGYEKINEYIKMTRDIRSYTEEYLQERGEALC